MADDVLENVDEQIDAAHEAGMDDIVLACQTMFYGPGEYGPLDSMTTEQKARLAMDFFYRIGGFDGVPGQLDSNGELYVSVGTPSADTNGNLRFSSSKGEYTWTGLQFTDELPTITVTHIFDRKKGEVVELAQPRKGKPSRIVFAPQAWKIGAGAETREAKATVRKASELEKNLEARIAAEQDAGRKAQLQQSLATIRAATEKVRLL